MHDFYALNTLPYAPQITESGIAISSRNKYPVESIKWIDYTYSEEGYRLFNFGVEEHEPNNEQAAAGSLRKLPEVPGYKADKSITGYEYEEQKTAVRLGQPSVERTILQLCRRFHLLRKKMMS